MLIDRSIYSRIKESLSPGLAVTVIYGPRQSGKTTLIGVLQKELTGHILSFTGDDLNTQDLFGKPILDNLKKVVGSANYIVVDEAQRIANVGLSLKLIIDNLKIPIIVSGSSSFDLSGKINEPLTGRTKTFYLYPFSFAEVKLHLPPQTPIDQKLDAFLRFGLYPKAFTLTTDKEKQEYLNELINSYLYKDILTMMEIRKPRKVVELLSLIALQLGNEVSVTELSRSLGISKVSVENYLDLLEKMFIIFNLRGFSRNLRKEITKTSKYYFYDLGLRNALIRNFNPLNLRQDVGGLFENFCIVERLKVLANRGSEANHYFWRTYEQKEIDLIENKDGRLNAFEFKINPAAKAKVSSFKEFLETYSGSQATTINSDSIENFLT
ncbi:MAG: ATP-binding protein [Patescibacteria group bacterium]